MYATHLTVNRSQFAIEAIDGMCYLLFSRDSSDGLVIRERNGVEHFATGLLVAKSTILSCKMGLLEVTHHDENFGLYQYAQECIQVLPFDDSGGQFSREIETPVYPCLRGALLAGGPRQISQNINMIVHAADLSCKLY